MSHEIKVDNTALELTLVTEGELNDDSKPYRELYGFLKAWREIGLIKEITMIQDVGDPNLYTYVIERTNGDTFDQTVLYTDADDKDPFVTAVLEPGWRLSVLAYEIPIREQLIYIKCNFGLISFEVEFALP